MASEPVAATVTSAASQAAFAPASPRMKLLRLTDEPRMTLPTAEAAMHLNRAPQTLRLWASYECGPIRPLRVNGRLAWPVADILRVLGGCPETTRHTGQ